MPVVRVDRPGGGARSDYRFSSLVLGIVNSMPFQMRKAQERARIDRSTSARRFEVRAAVELEVRTLTDSAAQLTASRLYRRIVMFITKTVVATSDVPARDGRRRRAAAPRRDGAGVDGARRRPPRTRRRRFGAVYIPNGAIMDQWIPEKVGAGFEFTPILKPLEPFRESLVVVNNLTRSHPGSQVGDHAVSAGRVPDRRVAEADRSGGHPRQHDDRSDHRQADRPGHAVPVARGGDRGLHRLRRRLLAGLQLLVHEHDLVELADDAAADGHQSAGGVRADVRRGRHRGAARCARMRDDRSILDSITQEANTLQRGLGTRDRDARRRVSRQPPRDRAPHPAHRSAQRQRGDASTRRSACPTRSRSTWR